MAPVAFMNSRRASTGRSYALSMNHLRYRFRGALNCRENARVSATTTQMAIHCRTNLSLRGLRVLEQQLGPFNDLAVVAIAALRRLFGNKRLLQRMQLWSFCKLH